MKLGAINLKHQFTKYTDHWPPRVVIEMNGYQFNLSRVKRKFVWHYQPDEAFIFIEGT
jgi:hypothetical protein